MRALLNVNVLIALIDADHSLHARATQWFSGQAEHGWASCPITQNGCIRIMSHPGYPNALRVPLVIERLAEASSSSYHEFWPDDVTLLDAMVADRARTHGPRQVTDVYLLAVAVRRGGQFVTFDTSVSVDAVGSAEKKHLLIL